MAELRLIKEMGKSFGFTNMTYETMRPFEIVNSSQRFSSAPAYYILTFDGDPGNGEEFLVALKICGIHSVDRRIYYNEEKLKFSVDFVETPARATIATVRKS